MVDDEFGLAVIGHTRQRTDDGGRTWQQVETAPDEMRSVVAADRDSWWLLGTGERSNSWGPAGLQHTDDAGRTWRSQDMGFEPCSIRSHSTAFQCEAPRGPVIFRRDGALAFPAERQVACHPVDSGGMLDLALQGLRKC
jgi:hypothetical protein